MCVLNQSQHPIDLLRRQHQLPLHIAHQRRQVIITSDIYCPQHLPHRGHTLACPLHFQVLSPDIDALMIFGLEAKDLIVGLLLVFEFEPVPLELLC